MYISVITLQDAKDYLRVDQGFNDDDTQITRMINAALSYVEQWTRVFVFERDLTYIMVDGFVRVYDYPINALVSPTDVTAERKTMYTNYSFGTATSDLVLTVGHPLPADVPDELIDVALEIIDLRYYGSKDRAAETIKELLSQTSIDILNRYRRFVI